MKTDAYHNDLDRFFHLSPDLLATASVRDGLWKLVNPAFTRILGWSDSELMAMPFLDLVHPDDLDRARQAIDRLAENRPLSHFEIRVRCKNGDHRWIAWEVRSDGDQDLVYATGRDVTDRKAAEEKLRESEARYRTLFNNMTEAFALGEVIWNEEGKAVDFRLLQINAAFTRQTGLGQEVLDRPLSESLPGLEQHWIKTYGRVALTGEPTTFENYNQDTRRHYQVHAYRPVPGRFAILFRDVTEERRAEQALRESEALYRSLASNLPNGAAFMVDHHLRYLLAEGKALRMAGMGSSDFEGRTVAEALGPRMAALYEPYFRSALAGTPFSWEHEAHGRHYISRGVPLRNDQGYIHAALVVSYDVTDRKAAEEALKRSEARERSRAAELEALMDAFPAIVFISRDRDCRRMIGSRATYDILRMEPGANVSVTAPDSERPDGFRPMKNGREIPASEMPMQKAAATGRPVRGYELDLLFSDGANKTILGNAIPLLNEDGDPYGAVSAFIDITERKQSEVEIERLARFPAENPNPVMRAEADGRVIYGNPPSRPLLEAWGTQVGRFLPDRWVETVREVLSADATREVDIPYGRRMFQFCIAPVSKDRYVNFYGQEITARKEAEEALKTTLESIGDGFYACDREWRVIYVNTAAEGMLGLQREEMLGKCYWDLFPPTRGTEIEREFHQAAEGEVRDFVHFYAPWGRWFHHRCFPREGGGMSVYIRDITEQKQMETALQNERELFQTIFVSVPVMLTVYDPALNMVHINRSLYDLTGWSESEIRECGILELVYPDPDYRQWVADYMQSLAPGFQDIRMTCKDGTVRETAWANIRISDGRQVGIGIDMTERKRMERELRRLNRTLEARVAERSAVAEARARELESMTGQLIEAEERERRRIADLLHDDLQQMLAGVQLQLSALCNRLPREPILTQVKTMVEESITKARSLSHELSPTMVHNAGLVEALEWLARNMEEQFGLRVELEAETPPEPDNPALKTFLYRAVHELLFNTFKHAQVETARVAISKTAGQLSLSVSDHGKGFDPALAAYSDTSTGLGLLSIRERARFFRGNLEIESEPDQGSRFVLTVPVA